MNKIGILKIVEVKDKTIGKFYVPKVDIVPYSNNIPYLITTKEANQNFNENTYFNPFVVTDDNAQANDFVIYISNSGEEFFGQVIMTTSIDDETKRQRCFIKINSLLEVETSNYYKVIVLPDMFSKNQLSVIIDGIMKNSDIVQVTMIDESRPLLKTDGSVNINPFNIKFSADDVVKINEEWVEKGGGVSMSMKFINEWMYKNKR